MPEEDHGIRVSKFTTQKEFEMSNITLNGIEYTPVTPAPTGTRAVVVVDRGWIFAGDVTRENGRIKLANAVWVFRWESIGFDGMLANPKDKKVTIKTVPTVDIPQSAEIFCVPVQDKWGM